MLPPFLRVLRVLRPLLLAAALGSAAVPSCMSLPDEGKPTLSTNPRDWREDVIYQILIDRFANGDPANDFNVHPDAPARYHGGDWKGLEDQLGYIQSLGVTALWISPVVKNVETDASIDGYHGYWAQDLTQTNPHFGDIASLRRLVKAAHARGIKVIVDIVTNHMGQLFYYDINQNGVPDIQISESGEKSPGDPDPVKSVVHITEYDPDYDPRGIQSRTSLGLAGPAPIVFIYDPAANKMPAGPPVLQQANAYHRRGRIVDYDHTLDPNPLRCEDNFDQPCSCTGSPKEACPDCNPGMACITYFDQTVTGDFPGGLKDVATEVPEVRAAMIDAYARWVEETDIDGFRIDTLKHVEHGFWREFVPGIRKRLAAQGKTNFFVFGESFDGDDTRTGSYTRPGEVDSVFYFPQKYQVFDDIFKSRPHKPTRKARKLWNARPANYGTDPQEFGIGLAPTQLLVNFLDNHDVSRFLFDQPDPRALKAALLVLLTEDGIPCIYYGTEQGFHGGNDPANREDLWPSGYDTTGDTFTYTSHLTKLRRSYAALSKGTLNVVFPRHVEGEETNDGATEGNDTDVLAFERTGGDAGDRYALVVVNADDANPHGVASDAGTFEVALPAGTQLVDVLNGRPGTITVDENKHIDLTLDPLEGVILVPQDQVVSGI